MDVFIPEEYVTRRRFEKKAAPATCGKGSKSHSNRNSNRIEVTKNKASSSNKGFGLVDIHEFGSSPLQERTVHM
ncbi:hypothetical protein Lal_00013410 [Lupinus albus]|nr:hypothetical protein Lal_00013410 [Lupinus albus]